MLSVAFALVLSQTSVGKPAAIIHMRNAPNTGANCPLNGAIEASNPAIAQRDTANGSRDGYPDMVHLSPVVLMATLNRTINGCFTPLILGGDVTLIRPKQDLPSGPGVR
jgi:hypothetical protein